MSAKGKDKGKKAKRARKGPSKKRQMDQKSESKKKDKKKKKALRGLRKKRFERRVFATIMIALVIVIIVAPAMYYMSEEGPVDDPTVDGTYIFYEGACGSCREFVETSYVPWFEDSGVQNIKLKNTEGDHAKRVRKEKALFREHYQVPGDFVQPIEIFVVKDGLTTIIIGDTSEEMFHSIFSLENQTRMAATSTGRFLFYQPDYLAPDQTEYLLWAFKGPPKTYDIDAPIGEYLDYFESTGKDEPIPDKYKFKEKVEMDLAFAVLVTVSGLLDGINPCAIAILIFFISFLYSSQGSRGRVIMMGSIYILAIYTIYFLIGLGLLGAMTSFEGTLFITMIGAIIVIILGFISMRDYLFPHLPFTVEVPQSLKKRITSLIERATLPTTLLIGLLIGAYTFPCSGAIYVVIVSLLAVETNFMLGLGYLVWYNLWFVMPLIIILVATSNKVMAEKMKDWEYKTARKLRAFMGMVMIGLGVFIIVWYIFVGI